MAWTRIGTLGGGSTSQPEGHPELLAGTIDGSNDTFTLSQSPSPSESSMISKNGVMQIQGRQYTLTGSTVVFAATAVPWPGDVLYAHRYTIAN